LYENKVITTDEYHTDQLLIFMALAEGLSRITCHDLSLHSETMIELLRQFIPEIEINTELIDENKNTLISIKGIGL
jgi:RNA 3'-terminal phosphate cyclase